MRLVYPLYYDENSDSNYPFESWCSLSNGSVTLDKDIFVDARLFPPTSRHDTFISKVVIGDTIQIVIADLRGELGIGTFYASSVPRVVSIFDANGLNIGILVSKSTDALGKLASWDVGTHVFSLSATKFTSTVVVPQPQVGVRAVKLDDASYFSGEVTLVGENGVQLTEENGNIRVDIVGEPLFLRKNCEIESADTSRLNNFVKKIVFDGTEILPDELGNFNIIVANVGDARPALRIVPQDTGLLVEFIGNNG